MSIIMTGTFTGYRSTMYLFYTSCLINFAAGTLSGIIIDKACAMAQKRLSLRPFTLIVLQLLMLMSVLYIIETKISVKFAEEFQTTTPGLIFTSVFFLVQTNLMTNINELLLR